MVSARQPVQGWALPVLDPKWRAVVALVRRDEVLARVGQKAGSDDEGDLWPLGLRPREKPLQRLRRNSLVVVLAVDEPGLNVLRAVHIGALDLGCDIASSVGRARLLRGALAPVNVDEAFEFAEKVE